jgi:Tol biopolymer transport system component/DNA-binding winged helix-turn-helix (wHTH) protein
VRFGTFEVDLHAGELRNSGVKVKLHGQPFEVLAILLTRPGEVVKREELQQRLWASDTYVDFDHGLNAAVNKLREALCDDADNPRYVETLPRRGYRFIGPIAQTAPVQATSTVEKELGEEKKEGALPERTSRRRRRAVVVWLAALCVLSAVGFYWMRSSRRLPKVRNYQQLTRDRLSKGYQTCGFWGSGLATDGLRLFFSEPGSDVVQVSVTGGEVVRVPSPLECFAFSDISPDKTELLGISNANSGAIDGPLWSMSVASGQAHRLGNLTGHVPAWSPDGERVAYATEHGFGIPEDVYIARKDGNDQKKVASFHGLVEAIRWSPTGSVLRVRVSGCDQLWEVGADGTNLHRMVLFPGESRDTCDIVWTPDGKYSVLTVWTAGSGGPDFWALRETTPSYFSSAAKPVQLTTGTMILWGATPSRDSKQIFAFGGQVRGELVRYDLKSGKLEPFLSGISADHLDFSRDGKWVTYVTFPEADLWRSRLDGSERLQLTRSLMAATPRWSPDGTHIAFAGHPGCCWKIYVISAEGGKPEVVAESESEHDYVNPSWAQDGNSLIFGESQFSSARKISSVDLRTGHVSIIPGSEGLYYGPNLSPDGRFIVAQTPGKGGKLLLFDRHTQKWSSLVDSETIHAGWPRWSGDSRYVYFHMMAQGTKQHQLYRVGIADRTIERLATVEVPEGTTGVWSPSFGIAPDGSPLLVRDLRIVEIYALDVDLP